jgi:predicted ribosome quality control (RQC) complex YloA/Tae2 family protein
VVRQLAEVQTRAAAIADRMRRLHAIKDWDTWLAIAERISTEREHAGAAERTEQSPQRYRSFVIEGYEVLVGRNSRENDELTFHVAAPDDFWMHVADYGGSHVVVRNPSRERTLPDAVLTKAAQLAAYYSQARNSPKVEVHYTRRKYVTKPKRTKPGLVKLSEFESIRVEPKNWGTE